MFLSFQRRSVLPERERKEFLEMKNLFFFEVDVVLLVCDLLRCLKLLHDEIAAALLLCTQT